MTEVLAELLSSELVGDQVLRALLPQEDMVYRGARTQWIVEGAGRPDLRIRGEKRSVLVESKFWADLTPEQIKGYPDARETEREVHEQAGRQLPTLYFLAPASREAHIKELTAGAPGSIRFRAWDDVYAALEPLLETLPESRDKFWLGEMLAAVRQEAALVSKIEPFSHDAVRSMSDHQTGTAFARCVQLVDLLRARLPESGDDNFVAGSKPDSFHSGGLAYGFSVASIGAISGWVGVWIDGWCLEHGGLLGVQLWQGKWNREPPPIIPGLAAVELPHSLWVPLKLDSSPADTLVESLLSQLRGIRRTLTAAASQAAQ